MLLLQFFRQLRLVVNHLFFRYQRSLDCILLQVLQRWKYLVRQSYNMGSSFSLRSLLRRNLQKIDGISPAYHRITRLKDQIYLAILFFFQHELQPIHTIDIITGTTVLIIVLPFQIIFPEWRCPIFCPVISRSRWVRCIVIYGHANDIIG